MSSRPFETRSPPRFPRDFAFYVAFPKSSIRPLGLPIYVARVPAAPFTRSYPRHLTLITRTAPCLRQLPSCVAVYPRDARSRRVLCLPRRSISEGGSLIPFAPSSGDVGIGEIDAVFEAGLSRPQILNCLDATPISRLCNRFNIYRSYQQFFAGYDRNFADLCVEHHLLRLRNRLIFEAIGIVFFDVCFYRFCLGIVSQTTHVPVHFVLRQGTQ